MSLEVCLSGLVAKKTISQQRADDMRQVYEELVAQYEPKFGRAAAEAMASDKAMASIESDFADRKRVELMQAKAQALIFDNAARRFKNNRTPGKPSPDGIIAHLVDSQYAPYANVEYQWKIVRDDAMRMMYDVLWKHRANAFGEMRGKSDFDKVISELAGKATGDTDAREFADAWRKTAEYLRGQFNAAGGRIPKLEGWMLPHQWDGVKVGLVPFEQFRKDLIDELDRSKMIDFDTGAPMSDFKLDDVVRQAYDSIHTEGAMGREASSVAGGRAVANRRTEHRVLHFETPEGWMRLNDKYGAMHPLDSMVHHVDSMARDIASMQVLGPNPAATVRWMKDVIGKGALTDPSLVARFSASRKKLTVDGIWEEITGMNRVAARPNVALFFSAVRNWQAATKLGSATIASLPDLATQAITTRFNGLPATAAIKEIVGQFNPADASHRDFVRRALLIQDEMIGRAAGFGRSHFNDMQGGVLTAPSLAAWRAGKIGAQDFLALQARSKLQAANELSRRASNLTMRASLLNLWTMNMRNATAMEFWNGITHFAHTPFDQLNSGFRGFLERYGVNAEQWGAIGATPRTEKFGTHWILPDAIENRDLAERLQRGILTELDYAVSTGGIRQRAAMTVGRPGTIPHEIVKTFGQFLMFPITVTYRHATRAMSLSHIGTKAGYAGAFLIATTIMGAMAEQLSEIIRGKDFRPMDNRDFWGKAFSRGGGLGYYGEIWDHAIAENGRGLTDLGNAPVLGSAENWANLLVRQPYIAAFGGKTPAGKPLEANFGKAAARMARYEMPGSNIWYLRLAYERLFLDQLDEMTGNHPGEARRRMERRAAEEGTSYFAPPGTSPGEWRAPSMVHLTGGNEQAEPAAP